MLECDGRTDSQEKQEKVKHKGLRHKPVQARVKYPDEDGVRLCPDISTPNAGFPLPGHVMTGPEVWREHGMEGYAWWEHDPVQSRLSAPSQGCRNEASKDLNLNHTDCIIEQLIEVRDRSLMVSVHCECDSEMRPRERLGG